MTHVKKVAVIGGGIIGMSTAVLAQETLPNVAVTVIAEKLSPFTTSDGAAGIWNPYLLGEVPQDVMRFWCEKTFSFLQNIFKSSDAAEHGVGLIPCYSLSETAEDPPPYKDVFIEWRIMNDKEMSLFPNRYKHGVFVTTYYAECTKLLPMFMKRFKTGGGKIIQKKINNIAELTGNYDAVVNCTGVQTARLVQDPLVKPIRGQVIRVRAPWIKFAVIGDKGFHILPNSDETICGGTHQEGDWNLDVDPEDRQRIWDGCTELVPSLKNAEILREWVGLRPGRCKPRIERETLSTSHGALEVIHNYGHGGSGVTLFWGCAHDAVRLLKEALINPVHSRL